MNEEPVFKPFGFDRNKLLHQMKVQDLSCIILTSPENVYYTTSFTVLPSSGNPILFTLRNRLPFFSFINRYGKVTLICWGFATDGVEFGVDEIIGFANFEEAVIILEKCLKAECKEDDRLGVESSCPHYVLRSINRALDQVRLFDVDAIMTQLRLIKSPVEIELIRKSTEIIETTMAELYDEVRVGMSRLELMKEAKSRLFKNGAMGISHVTFTFGRANPEIAIGEKLEPGQLVTLDLGGFYKGYASDNRRYMYTGEIPSTLLDHYNVMVEIVDVVGEALIPGSKYSDVFSTGVKQFKKYGLSPHQINHVGHNMGLETEEEWISDDPEKVIMEGMVINIELYSQMSTGDYIGNEETYIIGASGPTRISRLPREIRVVNTNYNSS